jgi:hypothetical protein
VFGIVSVSPLISLNDMIDECWQLIDEWGQWSVNTYVEMLLQ